MNLALVENNSNQSDISTLIDQWIEQESKGIQFPVPFDLAWQFAGYSKKANAKQSGLRGLKKDKHYIILDCNDSMPKLNGRPNQEIMLTVEAFKYIMGRAQYRPKSSCDSKLVYIIQCQETKVIKIGISNDPLFRLAAIQTGYPYKLIIARTIKPTKLSAIKIEKMLHEALSDFRLNGEWFDGLALCMIGS